MMLKEESKKQLITRATQYGVDPSGASRARIKSQSYRSLENREFY